MSMGVAINRVVNAYCLLTAVLLFSTAIFKIIGAFGQARVLDLPDAVLWLSTRNVMVLGAGIELMVFSLLAARAKPTTKLGAILWVGLLFAMYQMGRRWVGAEVLCPCLGKAGGWSPWVAAHEGQIVKVMLIYMIAGSAVLLLCSLSVRKGMSQMWLSVRRLQIARITEREARDRT